MDIITAERRLTRFVAERLGVSVDIGVFRGRLPPMLNSGTSVKLESGEINRGETLPDFHATVGFYAPERAIVQTMAARLLETLPVYGDADICAISPESIRFFDESEDGVFRARADLLLAVSFA